MNILAQIVETKRVRLQTAKRIRSERQLREEAMVSRSSAKPHTLLNALNNNDRINIIAEFKRKSPSKGVIRNDVSAEDMSRLYEAGGATAVSVLTEEDHFAGSLEDLRSVHEAVSIPVLRKDFIFDEYQIYESAGAGADALLLIVAALNDEKLQRLRVTAEDELGLDALVEVHTSEEMRRAIAAGARLIGVNNRDLLTFDVSLDTSAELALQVSADVVLVSESGLRDKESLHRLRALGYKGFLIGESLMRAERPDAALRELLGQ